MPNLLQIVQDPHWYLHAINLDEAKLYFVKTNAASLPAASFLDQRFDVSHSQTASLGLQELLNYIDSPQAAPTAAPQFIFHTAFCCSTLLARCVDLPSSNISLKEPAVLMALANYKRTGHRRLSNRVEAGRIFRMVNYLLFRPFGDGQSVVVKPTNTVNNIIGELMATHHQSKAILLHSDLKSFLLSTLKKGEQGRAFARQLFSIFLMDSAEAQQLPPNQLLKMTDSQIAAITWHLQLENFFAALQAFDERRVRSLHCDRFLADPEAILCKVAEHLTVPALQQNITQALANAPLRSNAKTPGQNYAADDRDKEYRAAESRFAEELDTILPWAKQLHFRFAYSDILTKAL